MKRGNHDVFISFRGEDTRTKFTCHLHEALSGNQIKAFIDYELHKGDEISPSLLRAIEESYISVVVFSKNYASSKWCLEELVKIMECRRVHGQIVIPVFYEIDPSHVRNQIGSYKEAFEKHEKNYSEVDMMIKVQKWKDVLTEAANLAGWDSHSRSYRDDFEFIQKIVKDVLQKLDCHYPPNDFEGLVGISRNFEPLEAIVREARSVGIWGMGGIGKTTIARYIFDKYSHQYEGSCFLENIQERSGERGKRLQSLRDKLHSKLLLEKNHRNRKAKSAFTECRIRRRRNFIVLDDLSSPEQLKYLVGDLQSFGTDSKIIITTRDKSVLESTRVEHIHIMKELDDEESLRLLSLNAFNEEYPELGYKELAQRAVAYCKGIPLALTVLGSFLHSKSKIEWDSALKKLEKIPKEEIQNVLRLSYDGLNYEEKQIFLDIACFLKGELIEHVTDLLDSFGLYAVIGMKSLRDKALINIYGDFVWMHDLIQEMGWEIVRQESIKNPGNRSRLWDFHDVCNVLKNNKGTAAIEGMTLDLSQSRQNLCLSADTFKKMPSLKYLKFTISSNMHGTLQLPFDLEPFSNELRYFEWHAYPLPSLPSNFCPEKLVTLRMPNSQFKRLWDGVQYLANLKEVSLQSCVELMELPDFSKAQNLKTVNLFGCRSLRHVHPSILSLDMLESLQLENCINIETLESKIHLRSLSVLEVKGCSSLMKFSLSAEEIRVLQLNDTGIEVLGPSIGHFNKVKVINLRGLRLKNLPNELSCLQSLEILNLSECGQVVSKQSLQVIFDGLQSLRELYLDNCHHLFELPDNVIHLLSLEKLMLDGSHLKRLPESIKHLSRLKILSIRGCRRIHSLPELPSSICFLNAGNCTLLRTVASNLLISFPQEEECKHISFQNCMNFDADKFIYSFYQYFRDLVFGYELRRGGGRALKQILRIFYPDHRIPEWFKHRSKGTSITLEHAPSSDHYFGLLLCIVLSPLMFPSFRYTLNIICRCYLEDGNTCIYSSRHTLYRIMEQWNLDHVCLSYDFGCILKEINAIRTNNQGASKVTFEFSITNRWIPDINNWSSLIKECGVYLVSASHYQTNEIGAGHKTKRKKHVMDISEVEQEDNTQGEMEHEVEGEMASDPCNKDLRRSGRVRKMNKRLEGYQLAP